MAAPRYLIISSDTRAGLARRVGPRVDEAAVPLDRVPPDTVSIAFAGRSDQAVVDGHDRA
jgi:hypothetical protein